MTDPRPDLGRVVAGAAGWSLMSSLVQRVAQVAVGIIVARLVVPADMGVYATALVAVALVVGISELGVAVGVVRTARPLACVAPTASTIAIAWSATVTGLLVLTAEPIARALGSPEASGPLRLMAFAVAVGGVSAVPAAIAQRAFRHRRRAVAELTGFITGSILTVTMAAAGAGAWSLAAGRLATNLVAAMVLLAASDLRHRLGFRLDAARELLGTGLPLTVAGLVALALWQIDYVIVGRHLGGVSLGLYVLAFNLASWPVTALSVAARSVMLPAFAELRSDPVRFSASLPFALRTVTCVAVPAVAVLTVTSTSLVRVIYGVRWTTSGEVLAILAWLGVLRVGADVMLDFLAAAGRVAAILWAHLFWLVALIPAVTIGARLGGLRGVAIGHVVIAAGIGVPLLFRSVASLGVDVGDTARALRRPATAGLAATTAGYVAVQPLPDDLAVLAVGTAVTLGICLLMLWPARPWRGAAVLLPLTLDSET